MPEKITYTITDEAPALATASFLPIVQHFAHAANIKIVTEDISLAQRILAAFNDYLSPEQQVSDSLADLGELAKLLKANIIKLPNISASIPQLTDAIAELQEKGYPIPNYPEEAKTSAEKEIKNRYDKVKGSAVNPVLREGNSDRRAPMAVKEYAKLHPHPMGPWNAESQSRVASMKANDFAHNEQSVTIEKAQNISIVFENEAGDVIPLKEDLALQSGEVIDGTFMSKKALVSFLEAQIRAAQNEDLLLSFHLKATMMKVSDPIIFGHALKAYFKNVFEKHATLLEQIEVNPNDGLGVMLKNLEILPQAQQEEIKASIDEALIQGPEMAMVDSNQGITNLHVPSDVIIDASMPAMIRNSGKMWNKEGQSQDTLAVIPDSSYAAVYQETIDFCKQNGAFDPTTMGTVPNVGLMAQKAEEYGSHDKTFELNENGTIQVLAENGDILMSFEVEAGDIWRMCQTKDQPIANWVDLAVNRAKATGWPAVFWLDENRAHDAELIKKVNQYLKKHDLSEIDIRILSPQKATRFTLERVKKGENTISVTGNVLRDYLTDLFPILELGTSAKMLSIVPLMNRGGLFETGAGGSAPKHVQQLVNENHLRWDSLGEFMALAVSLEHLADRAKKPEALILGKALDKATESYLKNSKSPSRKVGEIDNRGSHFYLALYWADELAKQTEDAAIAETFKSVAQEMADKEWQIIQELNQVQGKAVDIGGYYLPDAEKVAAVMRPSQTLNAIVDVL